MLLDRPGALVTLFLALNLPLPDCASMSTSLHFSKSQFSIWNKQVILSMPWGGREG